MTKEFLVHIVAVDENNGIGFKDNLLFPIKNDLKNFRKLTMGCTVIAGTKTVKTLPVLKGRTLVQLTRNPQNHTVQNDKVSAVISNVKGYLKGSTNNVHKPVFIIGGGEVYKETLKDVSVIVLTRIHAKAENCDTFYPDFLTERPPVYCSESTRHVDEATGLQYSIHIYGYDREHLKQFLQHKAKAEYNEREAAKKALASPT